MCACENNSVISDSVSLSNQLDADGNPSYSIRQCIICGEVETDAPELLCSESFVQVCS